MPSLGPTYLPLSFFLDSTNGWEQSVFIFLCLAYFPSVMPSRSVHIVTNDRISLLFWLDNIPLYICMAYIDHIFFTYLPIGEIHFLCVVFEISFTKCEWNYCSSIVYLSRWLLWFTWLYSGISLLKNQLLSLLATLWSYMIYFQSYVSKKWASPAKRRIFRKIWELLITLTYTVCFMAFCDK